MRFVVVLCACAVWAQDAARLIGTVVDASGAGVPGATVSLALAGANGAAVRAKTGESGLFTIPGLRPGAYDLSVEANGFQRQSIRGLRLETGRELSLAAIRLEVGAVAETVEVTAGTAHVETANAEVSTTVTHEQISRLPVFNRSPLGLITTQAGVSSGRGPTTINGMRVSFSNVTLDGVNIQDNAVRTNNLDFLPNLLLLDQVAEMTISTSNVVSAVGGGAAQVSFVTPSGTNSYHGSALWYNRNNAYAANTWFNNRDRIARPFLNQNQLGASAGGRIIRNKLFFYSNFEAFRLRQQSSLNRTIPTATARQGDFIYRNSGGAVQQVNLLRLKGVAVDPFTKGILDRVPGPENINNFRLGDSSDGLLRNYGGYSFTSQNNRTRNNALGKIDYIHSEKNHLSASYAWNSDLLDRTDVNNHNDYSRVPKVRNDNTTQFVSGTWRWNPRPSLTNELRGGFNFAPGDFVTSEQFGSFLVTGFPFSNPVNTIGLTDLRMTRTFNYQDNANWLKRRQNLSFGFQGQTVNLHTAFDNGIRPTWTVGFPTGSAFSLSAADLPGIGTADLNAANALLASLGGFVSTGTQLFNTLDPKTGFTPGALREANYRYHTWSWYLQDQWKVSRRLTIMAGLRYEYWTRLDERNGRALLPVMAQGKSAIDTLLSNSTLDFSGSIVGRPWYNRDLNNFAPNFGLAWDPVGKGKTSIRAGYSVNFVNDQLIGALDNNVITTNKGLQQQVTLRNQNARVSNGLPVIPAPVLQVPRKFSDNWALDRTSAFGMPDPNLRTPYVQQFHIGVQHEIKGAVVEVRYSGNRQTKLFRAFDFNQIIVKENGFLDDFLRAQGNANAALAAGRGYDPRYNAAVPGSQVLTVFPKVGGGGFLTDPVVTPLIRQGRVADLAQLYVDNALEGDVRFYRNNNSLGTNLMTNYSNGTYHSLQADIRKRLPKNVFFQGNYTWSKVLSDSSGDVQTRFEAFQDAANAKVERARTVFDLRHALKANFAYTPPFRSGRFRRLTEGWGLSGDTTWQSGNPLSILSARATLNRAARSAQNTANTTLNMDQLDSLIGVRMTPQGPMYIAAPALGPDGRAVVSDGQTPFAGQVFFHPVPGTIGGLQRRMFSGPATFDLNGSVQKTTRIREGHSLEIRVEAFNVLNHPAWYLEDQNIESTNFMKIAQTFTGRRLLQFGVYYRF
ncbi:MAG: TonB-dependent receptor [Acidobacteria bacterium]|nr:TonB-dependent receptor [Acidobacteriota bacterium]